MSAPTKPRSFAKELMMQTTAGGSAGFVEICIMHPLDLSKTRLQLQNAQTSKELRYKNLLDVFRKTIKNEGVRSLWKGVLPPIMVETPKRAVKFVSFEQYKKFFLFGSPTPTPLTFPLSGLCAGMTEALLVCPFEVTKVNLQANRSRDHIGTLQMAKYIYNKHGLGFNGMFKGVVPTVIRNGLYNLVFFGIYFNVNSYAPVYEEKYKTIGFKLITGFLSGVSGCTVNMPFDVVKSRLQIMNIDSKKYKTMFGTFKTIYQEEGIKAFYKGYLPKILRQGPGGSLMFLVYEYSYKYLKATFP